MAEDAAARLARLAMAGGGDIDVKELLDAVLLASAWAHADWGPGSSSPDAADSTAQRRKQGQADTTTQAEGSQASGSGGATDTAHEPVASVWLGDQVGAHTIPGKRVSVGRADALPDALGIGRALRPLRRPWLSGVHRRLDIDATVEHYTRTGMLIPRLTPAPEPWLEVIVVLDRGTAMAVWDETVRAFAKMLRALAAFRDVRVWHLEHPADDTPVLHDHHGSALSMHPDAAHHTQPARRLLLVVSDCAAPAWRQDALWRTLHTWGRTAPVALINPLPKRLWQRSGLDLPHTTATATVPASPGRLLSYRRPRLLRETERTKPWQALPVLELAPDQVLAWARTLMRTDPSGCEAVLVPATGRPPLRRRQQGPTGQPDAALTNDQVRAHAEAFTDDRQSPAVRLAIAASPLGSFTLPVLDVLRDRLVPEATLADTAEFLTAGLLTATRCESADMLYHFHPTAAAHVTSLLTRDQLWDTHFALSDHLAVHLQTPHGIPVVLHSPHADETLATSIRPIAYAAATTARLLGVEATDSLPETRRRPTAGLTAESPSKPQRGAAATIPEIPEDNPQATELYRTLARHFRSLLARASGSRAVHPSGLGQHKTLIETASGSGQGRQWTRNHDALELGEARWELVISVDTQLSGAYDDMDMPRMRERIYRVLETAFTQANVAPDAVHMEDRGDGVLLSVSVSARIPVTQLIGLWLVQVHENLRHENRILRVPLGLRIGMNFGPVRHDARGIRGRAIDLACRLADSAVARHLLDAKGVNLVLVTSQSLYEDAIRHGGSFIEPERYSSARLKLKEGEITAWFHLPGRPAPEIPAALTQRKKPDELALIMQDLTTLLENITPMLKRGSYPDRASGKKIAGLLRVVADQLDVYDDISASHDTVDQQPVRIGQTPEPPTDEQIIMREEPDVERLASLDDTEQEPLQLLRTEARPAAGNVPARLGQIPTAPFSGGLAELAQANQGAVARQAEADRRASAHATEADRRKALLEAATTSFSFIADAFLTTLTTAAPSAEVRKGNQGGWSVRIDDAQVTLSGPRETAPEVWRTTSTPAPFDVIASATLSLKVPANYHGYEGRSHSLWYADAQTENQYQWFETAFMDTPLRATTKTMEPFALDPHHESRTAISQTLGMHQVAWPFTPLVIGDLDELIGRWADWLAQAATGRLAHPSRMPERDPQGSWRR